MTIDQANETAQAAWRQTEPPSVTAVQAMAPRAIRRIKTVVIPDEESYPGFTFDVWLNFPADVMEDLQSGDTLRQTRAFHHLILSHNGWLDFDGNPYPSPRDDAFWDGPQAAPGDLRQLVDSALAEAIQASPLAQRMRAVSASGSAPSTSEA